MKNIYFLFLVIVVVGMCEKTHAQSRWIGIMPMEYNPSFAGNSGGHRIVALTGYEHSSGKSKQRGPYDYLVFPKRNSPLASISYDNFISKIGSGIGFFITSRKFSSGSNEDWYGYTVFDALKAGLIISPKISIGGKFTIAPSVGLNYKHLNYQVLPGELTVLYGNLNFKSDIFYLSTGFLINTDKFYIGYAHYFAPFNGVYDIRSFYEEGYVSNKQYGILQAGYKYQKSKESKTSYTLQKAMRTDQELDLLVALIDNLTFTFKYKKVLLGMATADGFYGMTGYQPNIFPHGVLEYQPYRIHGGIGYQSKRLKLFYSQELNNVNYVYSGELSCRVLIPNRKKTFYQF